ncbi:MAG: CPCC family cysteine-rich protein [Crocosphaera sp.]|nr:CPCC family cysteine-rich protein [Crocosphaera sp.]
MPYPKFYCSTIIMYFCPCCGYKSLEEEPPGTYLVCPICFWTDDESTKDIHDLRLAQLNFVNLGASDSRWLKDVRRPTKEEIRDSQWELLDKQIEEKGIEIKKKVFHAFSNIHKNNGVSLDEANEIWRIIDYAYNFAVFDLEANQLLAEVRAKDIEYEWREIPKPTLEKCSNYILFVSHYLDPIGWQYYIPAYMVWSIDQYIEPKINYFESVLKLLLEKNHYVLDYDLKIIHSVSIDQYLAILLSEQLSTIRLFLQFVLDYATLWEDDIESIQQYLNKIY